MTDKPTEADKAALLFKSDDAIEWANEWTRIAHEIDFHKLSKEDLSDWMLGWFANALVTGKDIGRQSLKAENERLREALMRFVDQYAHCDVSEIQKSNGAFSKRILEARAAINQEEG